MREFSIFKEKGSGLYYFVVHKGQEILHSSCKTTYVKAYNYAKEYMAFDGVPMSHLNRKVIWVSTE